MEKIEIDGKEYFEIKQEDTDRLPKQKSDKDLLKNNPFLRDIPECYVRNKDD
jgi:hypothetical protein